MKFTIVPVTAFMQNCSILVCTATGEAAVVDPGGDLDRIEAAIAQQSATVTTILLTHAHIDHAGATAALAAKLSVPIVGPHEGDRMWIQSLDQQAAMFGLPAGDPFEPDRWLAHGDTVQIGASTLEVRFCPGHTAGHVVFVDHDGKLAVVGDVLFAGSIGRSDLPGGDHRTLIQSITDHLLSLDDDYTVIGGHGPTTTIGAERRGNPFLQG